MTFQELNEMIDIEVVKGILESLGVKIPKSGNFKLRDEKTPSSAIYLSNGKIRIKDFGNGFNGDLFDCLIEYFGMDKQKAKSYVMDYLGIKKTNQDFSSHKRVNKVNPISPIKEDYLTQKEIKYYIDNKLITLKELAKTNKPKLIEVIQKIIPLGYLKTAHEKDKKAFLKAIRYDPYRDEPVAITYKPNGEILSIRPRRPKENKDNLKWYPAKIYKKSFENPNQYTQIRITNPKDPIFIIEGTHDYLTALLLGINFIALPSKTYTNFKEEELKLLKGGKYNFVIVPDLDYNNKEEFQNFIKVLEKNNNILLSQLEPFIKEVFVLNMRQAFSFFKGIEKVKDLSDLCSVSDVYNSPYLKTFWLLESFIYRDEYLKGVNYEN